MASDMRRNTRTPASKEFNDYRPAPLTRRDSYVADPQQPPVELHSQIPHPADAHVLCQSRGLHNVGKRLHFLIKDLT